MNWSRVGSFCGWLGCNTLWYGLGALGVTGIAWAFNVFVFFAWLGLILVLLLTWYKRHCKLAREAYTVTPRPVPIWLDFICDVGLAILLAATGHWFYAGLIIASAVLSVDVVKPAAASAPSVSS